MVLRRFGPFLVLALFVSLTAVTSNRLWRMAQIRGWVPGATTQRAFVKERGRQPQEPSKPGSDDLFWVSWTSSEYGAEELGRVFVEQESWRRFRPETRIEVVRIPGSSETWLRSENASSDGRPDFDVLLLGIELAGVVWGYRLVADPRRKEEKILPEGSLGIAPELGEPEAPTRPARGSAYLLAAAGLGVGGLVVFAFFAGTADGVENAVDFFKTPAFLESLLLGFVLGPFAARVRPVVSHLPKVVLPLLCAAAGLVLGLATAAVLRFLPMELPVLWSWMALCGAPVSGAFIGAYRQRF